MNTALIMGITEQDRAYLAELLLKKDYRVVGAFRRGNSNTSTIYRGFCVPADGSTALA